MDYFQDEVQPLVLLLLARSHLGPVLVEPVVLEQVPQLLLLLRHVMPSMHPDLHRALLLILRRVRDQPLHSFWQRFFWQLPS